MKMNYQFLLFFLLLFASSFAQVGVGTTTPTGALDISSATNGVVIPRVVLTSKAVSGPVVNPQGGALTSGTLVWNTATAGVIPNNVIPGFYYWDVPTLKWVALGGVNSNNWTLNGNTGVDGGTTILAGTNYIGTTDNQNLDIHTNNTYVGRFSSLGEFFLGTLNTILPGDLMNSVGNVTFPWAVNGYTNFDGGAVFGGIMSGTSTYGAVQGEYYGTSANGNGVRGLNISTTAGNGILGQYAGTNIGTGVLGQYNGTSLTGLRIGTRGYSGLGLGNQQIGVYGDYNAAAWGIGVIGISFGGGVPGGNNDIAVVGWRANNGNYSGYFNGNHVIANGTKSASVGTSKGNQLLYVTETPGVWFEDIGRAKLVNGMVEVKLDPLFIETIFIDEQHPMSVFLQEEGDSKGLYVIPGKDGFVVKEKNGGTSNISFSYRIMAKRKNFQDHRFGNDPVWGEGDTRKYNQYAVPPPIDYTENVKFQEAQKRNYKPTPMPEGFISAMQLQTPTGSMAKPTETPAEATK
jgi:hypothetical protein